MNPTNAALLVELLLQFALKQQEIALMFQQAQGGEVSDEQVAASSVARDVALLKAEARVEGTTPQG